jgi:hypothetical protein
MALRTLCRRCTALASNQSIAQWDGDYTAAYRFDPAITGQNKALTQPNLSDKGNEQFVIQMVEDPAEKWLLWR